VELHDEDVVAREHRLVRRGRRWLSRILHVRLHVRRSGGPCYGRKLRTPSVGSQGGTVEIPAGNGVERLGFGADWPATPMTPEHHLVLGPSCSTQPVVPKGRRRLVDAPGKGLLGAKGG